MLRRTLYIRIDSPTLKGLGWINLLFCAISIYTDAIVPCVFTLVLFGGCHWWADLEPLEEDDHDD